MWRTILSPEEDQLLREERSCLADLLAAMARLRAEPRDEATIKASLQQLEDLFLLVVAGEFNSGKSAFINALLGTPIADVGVTPTTRRISLIKYGPENRTIEEPYFETVTAELDLLKHVNIVDTPGTNAIHREHEAITEEFIPRSDLVLFVTSADRPFTESERRFLERIRAWGKKTVIVINKIDILETTDDTEQIIAFVKQSVQRLLGSLPEIFAISSRGALREKLANQEGSAADFPRLEDYIRTRLDDREQVRLKLLNPLGVGLYLARKYYSSVQENYQTLSEDIACLEEIQREHGFFEKDMVQDFHLRVAQIDNLLHEFEKRGLEFFDDRIRLARIPDLVNKAKLQSDYQRAVVADLPRQLERRVEEMIDWMVSGELSQWQNVMEHLNRRRHHFKDGIVGQVGGRFQYDRSKLIESVGHQVQETVAKYNRSTESAQMAERVQMAVAGTALVEAGAIGLGAAVTLVATSTMADVTGILAAGTLAILGLFVIPRRRQKAKAELRQKTQEMRTRILEALKTQFDEELQQSLKRIDEAIRPYSRFVRSEEQHFRESANELKVIMDRMEVLKAQLASA